ncbi:MAG: hypothetical protein JW795_03585 [Chitinivibrionales bacterium]|nr:hypothetical protein [Chitinivibrionales bacterium]
MKKVLLTTVCGPFGVDSDDCTRHIMPELFHAQVTRSQDIFSLRSTYISYGLEYIANNIQTPTVVLQYPTMKQFERELKKGYDFVGISFVIPTFEKMKKMSLVVRAASSHSKIILGGYGTMLPECEQYGDYVCREEGVGFMRRLLGEKETDAQRCHVVYPTTTKVVGFPFTRGAVVLAGLGCPHGCEFCATSHFHKMRHIPLVKTGTQLYQEICRVHKILGDSTLPIGIIEEDFLMQKERAAEYLACVKKNTTVQPKISCFASAYSISLWDPEDLVRMGIEAIWIGVESKNASYNKLKGIDVSKTMDTLHAHGINTLASLILGHDFHTEKTLWDDVEYLMSLKPSLSQILILTPGCSTPLFERLRLDGRLLSDIPKYHWDGFHLTFKHPHISKEKMESLILKAYDEEYQRLGPSVIRFIEKQFAGYRRFRDATDPLLKNRALQYKELCLKALPLFPTALQFAPNSTVARSIKDIQAAIIAELGSGGFKTRALSYAVPLLASMERFKLAHFGYGQTNMQRTEYRISDSILKPAILQGGETLTIQPQQSYAAHFPLVVDLHGVMNRVTSALLAKRVETYLKENKGHCALNFSGITGIECPALLEFLKGLRSYRDRIKLISIDSVRLDIADAITYARKHFDVFSDVEGLTASLPAGC